jgi:hypothetical protein
VYSKEMLLGKGLELRHDSGYLMKLVIELEGVMKEKQQLLEKNESLASEISILLENLNQREKADQLQEQQ